jgi:hypothetical protein
MRKISFLGLVIALSFLMGCKSTYEKRGDEHLAAGRLKNALINYNAAEEKGKLSEEFHDNHALALSQMMIKIVKDNSMSTAALGYYEAIEKKHREGLLKNAPTVAQIAENLANAGALQVMQNDGQFGFVIEGYNNIKLANELVKAHSADGAKVKEARQKADDFYVKSVLDQANIESTVAAEYHLLLGKKMMPENKEILDALNAVRKKNRSDFLIFQAHGIERPSPLIDHNAYIMAFPSVKISNTGLAGELQLWNSAGNNTMLAAQNIKLVSTDGKEIEAKQTSVGKCTSPELDEKKDFINKENTYKPGEEMLFITEGKCNVGISYSFGSDFTPDYILYKDKFGEGRKYLGF